MSVLGRWRIVEMDDYTDDYPDMMEPAYILFGDHGSGEFAFGCVTGQIFAGGDTDAVEFSWTGNDEAGGDGSAELQPDGSLKVKSASTAATKPTSSLAGILLQQPARRDQSSPWRCRRAAPRARLKASPTPAHLQQELRM